MDIIKGLFGLFLFLFIMGVLSVATYAAYIYRDWPDKW